MSGYKGRYGNMKDHNSKNIYAHRYSYELHIGPIPDGMTIDHKCHTPCCVNPDHLRLATRSQQQWNKRGTAKSGYKGVSLHSSGLYVARLHAHYKRYFLGYFKTPEEAASAYAAKYKSIHGKYACNKHKGTDIDT